MVFDNSRENTTDPTDMIEYLAWNMELCYRTMDRSRSDKIMLLMHLTSFSIFNNPPPAVTKETIQILSGSFPESLGVCILLDAPGYFRTFYAMIKNFVDPKTLSKVIFITGDITDGSPNDMQLRDVIGDNWRELTGAGEPVAAQAWSPKAKRMVDASPGFDVEVYWPDVQAREVAYQRTMGRGVSRDSYGFEGDGGDIKTVASAGVGGGGGGGTDVFHNPHSQPSGGRSGRSGGSPRNGGGSGGSKRARRLNVGGRRCDEFNQEEFRAFRKGLGISSSFLDGGSFDFAALAPGGGKGGNLMAATKDKRFIVKEMNAGDHKSLLKVTVAYMRHVGSARGSGSTPATPAPTLLCRLLAHFQDPSSKRIFVAMENCLPHPGPYAGIYDLKGTNDDKTLLLNGDKVKDVHKRIWQAHLWLGKGMWSVERHRYVLVGHARDGVCEVCGVLSMCTA